MEANEKQEGSTQAGRQTYKMQEGSASCAGEFYEIELAMLFLLRGTKSVKNQEIDSFRLASNMEEAYPFDDIVFEYKKGKESNLILLQAKHKENIVKYAIKWDNLFKSSKEFGIWNYLYGFKKMNLADVLKGPYDRMELVLYTNAPLAQDEKELGLKECDPNEFYRMNGKKVGKIVCDDKILQNLNLNSNNLKKGKIGEFLKFFRLAYGQPNHTDLESMIKKEISSIYKISEFDAEIIYNELFIKVRNWWQKPYILYENNDWFDKSRKNLSQPLLSHYTDLMKMKLQNTRIIYKSTDEFEECTIHSDRPPSPKRARTSCTLKLGNCFKSNKIINVVCDEKSKILSCVKVFQMLEKCFSNKYCILLDDTSFEKECVKSKVLEAFKGNCCLLVICSFRPIPSELIQIVRKTENKQIIWIGATQTQSEISTISLEVGFKHLKDEVRHNILKNNPITLQGEIVTLVDLVDDSDCDEIITDDLLVDLVTGKVIVGQPLDGLGEVASYHIPRMLKRKGSKEQYRSDQIRPDDDNKFVLISACPGMGKSTLVSSMMGEKFHWKYRIDLIRYSELLKNQQNMEALLFLKKAIVMSNYEYELFRVAYEHKGGIVLFFDGFDEIAPNYKDKVLQLFQSLRSSKVNEMWVTTRPGFEQELEAMLNTEAFHLEPFSHDDQKKFLMNICNDSDDNKVEDTLEKFSIAINDSGFTSVPLHLKMISEMRNEIISSEMDIFSLYRKFFEIKFYEVAKRGKLKLDLSIPETKDMVDENYKIAWEKHEKLALLTMFDKYDLMQVLSIEEIIDIMKMMVTEVGKGKEKNGVVYGIIDDKPTFTHRTYAEFFAASWMKNFYLKNCDKKDFRKLEIFYNMQFSGTTLRKFFDFYLCGDSEACRAVLSENYSKLTKMIEDELLEKDLAGRTAYHLLCGYRLRRIEHSLQIKLANDDLKDELFKFTPSQYSIMKHTRSSVVFFYKIEMKPYLEYVLNENVSGEVHKTLHWACANGDLSLLKNSIKNGANVNASDNYYITPLHLAAAFGQIDVMKVLIKNGALLNETDRDDSTPLLLAVHYGKLEAAEFLITNGADLNIKDKYRNTALLWAAKMGYDCLVKSMIIRDADVNVQNEIGFTAFLIAAQEGHLKVVRFFLENKADPKLIGLCYDGELLCAAAYNGHNDVVRELLHHGADPNETSCFRITPICKAALNGHNDVVQTLIDFGADPKLKYFFDFDPLLRAAERGHIQIAKILLNHGADSNVKDDSNKTPLYWSVENGHVEMTQVLLDGKADPNLKTGEENWPAIYHAASRGSGEIVEMLIDRGVGINETTEDGKTLLHLAAGRGHIELVRSLISWGANIGHMDEDGWTPLFHAASNGHSEVVKILLDNEASVALKNKSGETPLQLARQKGYNAIVAILMAAGAHGEVE